MLRVHSIFKYLKGVELVYNFDSKFWKIGQNVEIRQNNLKILDYLINFNSCWSYSDQKFYYTRFGYLSIKLSIYKPSCDWEANFCFRPRSEPISLLVTPSLPPSLTEWLPPNSRIVAIPSCRFLVTFSGYSNSSYPDAWSMNFL